MIVKSDLSKTLKKSNQMVRYVKNSESDSDRDKDCDNSLVVLYHNKKVIYIKLDYDAAKNSFDFIVTPGATLQFELSESNSEEKRGMHESNGFMAFY